MFAWALYLTLCTDGKCISAPVARSVNGEQCTVILKAYAETMPEFIEQGTDGELECKPYTPKVKGKSV